MNMQPIEGITPDMLWTTMIVVVGLGALIVLGDKVAEVFRKRKERKKQPDENLADDISRKVVAQMESRFAEVDRKLANDKAMIEAHTREINDLRQRVENTETGIRALCRGVLALLNQANNKGSQKEVQEASAEFIKYLTDK